jgi:hypothetical protein
VLAVTLGQVPRIMGGKSKLCGCLKLLRVGVRGLVIWGFVPARIMLKR